MKYIKVIWMHDFPEEPVVLYSELDENRFEIRKVEVFREGPHGWANESNKTHNTDLGSEPIPSIQEISSDPEFIPFEITKDEFEEIWAQAMLG